MSGSMTATFSRTDDGYCVLLVDGRPVGRVEHPDDAQAVCVILNAAARASGAERVLRRLPDAVGDFDGGEHERDEDGDGGDDRSWESAWRTEIERHDRTQRALETARAKIRSLEARAKAAEQLRRRGCGCGAADLCEDCLSLLAVAAGRREES